MRLRRIIKVGGVMTSLFVSGGIITLWARSMFKLDAGYRISSTSIDGRYGHVEWDIASDRGFIFCSRCTSVPATPKLAAELVRDDRERGLGTFQNWFGWYFTVIEDNSPSWEDFVFGMHQFDLSSGSTSHQRDWVRHQYCVDFPLWLPLLLASLPADIAALQILRHRRARRRAARNHCPTCNYDLRESPGRCPECGRDSGVDALSIQRGDIKRDLQ